MKRLSRPAGIALMAVAVTCAFTGVACAYLDPGTIQFAVQVLIAGIVGALSAVVFYWRRVTGFVSRLFRRGPRSEAEEKKDE